MGVQAPGLGLDGDGHSCCDGDGASLIFADKVGVMLARDISALDPNTFVVGVTSTELFMTDPALAQNGAMSNHWKTGHSCIKRPAAELHAIAPSRNPEVGVYNQTF
jgi:phosphomannomutase/phosphoglucomutase